MRIVLSMALLLCGAALTAEAQTNLDTMGVSSLLAQDPTLTGSGVYVSQIESPSGTGNDFEVDPAVVSLPAKRFSFHSALGVATGFPNKVGTDSQHADDVAGNFYGLATGAAPGVPGVANYQVVFFDSTVIQRLTPVRQVIFNESYGLDGSPATRDKQYDNYIAKFHTIAVAAVGNSGGIQSPSDCYNGLGVADSDGTHAIGPTFDGRCKPDISALGGATSYATGYVSGAAAELVQSGRRMGKNAPAAVDMRTIKALLLNGAVKPGGWTQSATVPLDYTYGAGVLNVLNSYNELQAGRYAPAARTLELSSTGNYPISSATSISAVKGWDYREIESGAAKAGVNHYRITTSGTGALIATLTWARHFQANGINQLALYLYDSGGNQLGESISPVDNIQHFYLSNLNPGTYEIQVVKIAGKAGKSGFVSANETYALVWDFAR